MDFRIVCVVAFLIGASFAAECAVAPMDSARLHALAGRIYQANDQTTKDYLRGDSAAALARLKNAVGEQDWIALYVLGNATWTNFPAESFAWHERAYQLSGGNLAVLVELALHYTRQEECSKAIEAWGQIESAGMLRDDLAFVASYCYLKVGDESTAQRLFGRASVHEYADAMRMFGEIWIPGNIYGRHAKAVAAITAGGRSADLGIALQNAYGFPVGKARGLALVAIADAARSARESIEIRESAEHLNCLRKAFESEAQATTQHSEFDSKISKAWADQLDACHLVTGQSPLPNDSILSLFLIQIALDQKLATAQQLLDRHGEVLGARARSEAGDFAALAILATLQMRTQDPGISDTEQLGWSRYGKPEYAADIIGRRINADGRATPETLALIEKAREQFPRDSTLLRLWLSYGNPSAEAERAGWREVALMEFHPPTLGGQNLWEAMVKLRAFAGR